MTTHVCILGIDGSGKSTVSNTLPGVLSGSTGIRAASAGESFRVEDPDRTLLAPDFSPTGRPVTTRIAHWLKLAAKRYTDHRFLYPVFKILQLAFQDAAARRIERRYGPDVVVSDGNLILSVAGRAVNYFRPAHKSDDSWDVGAGRLGDILHQFNGSRSQEGWVGALVWISRLLKRVGFHTLWLPDVVVLLDLTPEVALDRVCSRGGKVDAHENRVDLGRARGMYLRTADAVEAVCGEPAVIRISVAHQTPGAVIARTMDALQDRFDVCPADRSHETLGTVEEGGGALTTYLSAGYLLRCLVGRFFQGTWRELLFPFSKLGRRFMREGYSASVMQDIYDQDDKPISVVDRPFLGYSLHRAVYDRLGLLVPQITRQLLMRKGPIRIFTAPSGLAEDVFRAIQTFSLTRPGGSSRIEITALDDPDDRIRVHLHDKCEQLGVGLNFVQGDLTDPRWSNNAEEPFDIALFVGLSSWLPKPQVLQHLRNLRRNLGDDGVLLTDVFTPGAYAVSGWHAGYSASYYEPDAFATLLEMSGFDRQSVSVSSGRNGLNHVMVCGPKVTEVRKAGGSSELCRSEMEETEAVDLAAD